MTEPLGSYAFLSWLRTGVSTGIPRIDGEGPAAPRAQVELAMTSSLPSSPSGVNLDETQQPSRRSPLVAVHVREFTTHGGGDRG